MKSIDDKIDGDFFVSEQVVLRGMATGNITVERGGSIELYGMCCRNVFVEAGGEAAIYGTIGGDLVNRGGRATVFGIINGFVHDVFNQTHIAAKAIVKSERAKD